MPSYDDQLEAYRSQLSSIASASVGQAPGSGAMASAGLAFNSMMSDMARAASFVHSVPITPGAYGVPVMGRSPYNMGLGEAAWAMTGLSSPSTPMYGEDYRFLATAKLSRFSDSAATGILSGGMGLAAGVATGALAGSAVGGPFGAIAGAVVGGVTSMAVSSGLAGQAGNISNLTDTIRTVTPSVFGGSGMGKSSARDMARWINRNAISDSTSWLGSGSDQIDIANIALQGGAKYGLFSGTTDVDSFKKEFTELTKTIKEVSNTLRMSREEIVPLIAEMRQGGFYGAGAAHSGILAGAGMAHMSGLNYGAMHEAGLRGSAVFRGTGIPTQFGYQTAQSSLFQVSRLQQTGAVAPEVINQLGGRSGAAEALTQNMAMFTQGPMGRATAAILMQGQGGINGSAMAAMLSGNMSGALGSAELNPANTLNPMNVGRLWGNLGPQNAQMLQMGWINHYAKMYQSQYNTSLEGGVGLALQQLGPSMGINPNAANVGLYTSMIQNMPRMIQDQQSAIMSERRRASADAYDSKYDFWENVGVRGAGRSIRRPFTSAGEFMSMAGSTISDSAEAFSDWVAERRSSPMSRSAVSMAIAESPGGLSGASKFAAGGIVSRPDYEVLEKVGMVNQEWSGAGAWRYEPPRLGWATGDKYVSSENMEKYKNLLSSIRGAAVEDLNSGNVEALKKAFRSYSTRESSDLGANIRAGKADAGDVVKSVVRAREIASKAGLKGSGAEIAKAWGEVVLGVDAGKLSDSVSSLGSSGVDFHTDYIREKLDEDIESLGLFSHGRLGGISDEDKKALRDTRVLSAIDRFRRQDNISEEEVRQIFQEAGGSEKGIGGLVQLQFRKGAGDRLSSAIGHTKILAASTALADSLSPLARNIVDSVSRKSGAAYEAIKGLADKGETDKLINLSESDLSVLTDKRETAQVRQFGETAKKVVRTADALSKNTDLKSREKMLSDFGYSANDASKLAKEAYNKDRWSSILYGDVASSLISSDKSATNASARISQQAMAFRAGGGDMQLESMKQVYTALKALNEKIDRVGKPPGSTQ